MLNSNKTIALAGLLGSLALAGAGVAQAHAEDAPTKCVRNADGVTCSQEIDRRYVTEDGTLVVEQAFKCSTYDSASQAEGSAKVVDGGSSGSDCSHHNQVSR